jgi:nitrite reductase/ring-hydroxylating ferredoxin subunit
MATRQKVANVDDFPEDGSRVFAEIGGIEVAVFRIDGRYHAVANYCVHQGGPLCEGDLTGRYEVGEEGWEWTYDSAEKNVLCPWHGWKFDVTTGKNVDDERYAVPTYEVEVENGEVFVRR